MTREQLIERAQYKTVDPDTSFPALTTLLYKVCGQDQTKFEEACRLLTLFMNNAVNEYIEDQRN